jgi:pSer/pThr/pTyr-binding forkhead associated (FHA) protein
MDVILKVLEGAKSGAKIAVKKTEFIIGRSQGCHLCAGSSAVSRQHCAILRQDNRVSIKDLGSRNGTVVNGIKIAEETELASGDEVTVGPLKFLVTISTGISNAKKPGVKSVAEAVVRTAETPMGSVGDDDITKWLLGPVSALTETQTIRIDDTNAIQKMREAAEAAAAASEGEAKATEPAAEELKAESPATKPGPGKLPKLPEKAGTKDSREAAVEALRAWSRRR